MNPIVESDGSSWDPAGAIELPSRYEVLGVLGRGSVSTMVEAFAPALERSVAIRVIHRDPDGRQQIRLLREAEALSRISHPNVVRAYEVGVVEEGAFLTMERLRGQSLRDWLRRSPSPSWTECVEIFVLIGEALSALHERGVIHRDLKPGNVILGEDGRVTLIDFRLARLLDDAETLPERHDPLTLPGTPLGTPAYMPLAQLRGAPADAQSDQFSFCVALYEALYGERPFADGSIEALMTSMRDHQVRPVPAQTRGVPPGLRRLLLRGLAFDARDRWPSMAALVKELRWLLVLRHYLGWSWR